MTSDHGVPQRDPREVHRHLYCERLFLAQHRDLAPQPPHLLLDRLARHPGVGCRLQLRGPPPAHGLGLELGGDGAPLTPSRCSCLSIGFHQPPPPKVRASEAFTRSSQFQVASHAGGRTGRPPGLSPSQTGSGTNETHRLVDGDRLGAQFARGPEHCSAAPCPPRPIAPSLVDTAAQTVKARRSPHQPATPSPPGSRSRSARDCTSATHPRVRGTDGQSRNPGQ